MPKRIQLSRAKGWRKTQNTVKVDRATIWGNPYYIAPQPKNGDIKDPFWCITRLEAVVKFDWWLRYTETGKELAKLAKAMIRGRNVACWCTPTQVCHGDILLKIANA